MSEKNKVYKPKPISGFPEWLPEERLVEQKWFDHIRRVFESYGFCSIETPSVEELDVISAKGEVDKEIYVIERLHKNEDSDKEARLALHFDQTVPLARYVAMRFNDLTFPFKRYQMQRVWRGERPQMGRMREFYQCDIDVIGVDNLPISFDAEVAAIMYEVLDGIVGFARPQLRISNRKILMGFLDSLEISTRDGGTNKLTSEQKMLIIREIDKLEKIGIDLVLRNIADIGSQTGIGFGLDEPIKPFIELCETKIRPGIDLMEYFQEQRDINTSHPQLREGIIELQQVLGYLSYLPENTVVGDLSIVRGLDYYTGTVYETQLLDVPEFTGSVCSGGRYDDLAGSYINKHLPGVGISIGFSRLFDVMRQVHPDKLGIGAKSPAHIMMFCPKDEDMIAEARTTARTLRERGFNVEMYHAPQKMQKQLAYAEKKGIPYVWFPPFEKGNAHEVKNMATGKQVPADPSGWSMDK